MVRNSSEFSEIVLDQIDENRIYFDTNNIFMAKENSTLYVSASPNADDTRSSSWAQKIGHVSQCIVQMIYIFPGIEPSKRRRCASIYVHFILINPFMGSRWAGAEELWRA